MAKKKIKKKNLKSQTLSKEDKAFFAALKRTDELEKQNKGWLKEMRDLLESCDKMR